MDNKTKHTPGPWEAAKKGYPTTRIEASTGQIICDVNSIHFSGTGEANAKLIAAAPELLEALIEAKKELEYHNWQNTKTYNEIISAIKKATE